eukprot:gene17204-biopygen8490
MVFKENFDKLSTEQSGGARSASTGSGPLGGGGQRRRGCGGRQRGFGTKSMILGRQISEGQPLFFVSGLYRRALEKARAGAPPERIICACAAHLHLPVNHGSAAPAIRTAACRRCHVLGFRGRRCPRRARYVMGCRGWGAGREPRAAHCGHLQRPCRAARSSGCPGLAERRGGVGDETNKCVAISPTRQRMTSPLLLSAQASSGRHCRAPPRGREPRRARNEAAGILRGATR